jgi:hypothetical protein
LSVDDTVADVNISKAMSWVDEIKLGERSRDDLANLTWAINSPAVHSDPAYTKAVYEFLDNEVKNAIPNRVDPKAAAVAALRKIGEILTRGDSFRWTLQKGPHGVPIPLAVP